jgi:hypothetical protein
MQRIFSDEGSLGLARGPPTVITDARYRDVLEHGAELSRSDILSGSNRPLDQEFRGDADSTMVDDFKQLHRRIYTSVCLSFPCSKQFGIPSREREGERERERGREMYA